MLVTEDVIRSLAGFRGEQAPVTSCYLDIDGRRFVRRQDYEHELDLLLREARAKANGNSSVAADLRKIEEYVKAGVDRSRTKGLAIFSCTAHDLWEVIPLPVSVASRVVVNHFPAVGQLESVVQELDSFGVLLADRQRARVFVFRLGELVASSEVVDDLPRDYDERGERERGDTQHHVEALANQHLRHAADAAWEMFQEHGFSRLSLGAPESIAKILEGLLHRYLKERVVGRMHVSVAASVDDIRTAAIEIEAECERKREAEQVARLRDAVGSGGRGVVGLDATLEALAERRIERLVVSSGYSHPGWRCDECRYLARVGRSCPVCEREMDKVDDIVEEAVEEALAQSCRVEICIGNADLDVLGRIGALLRY